jgi:hypothetical protein
MRRLELAGNLLFLLPAIIGIVIGYVVPVEGQRHYTKQSVAVLVHHGE